MAAYRPPYTITPRIVDLVVRIGEALGDKARSSRSASPALRRANRARTVQASLAIEGNTLTIDQVTAIVAGRRVAGPEREIREIRNAVAAYDRMPRWNPASSADLRAAHAVLMAGLVERPGAYRRKGVGIRRGGRIIHVAPPAERVPALVRDLLGWLRRSGEHPVIAGCVLHYELEFIHPFEDGNGRLGRLWNSLVLFAWDPVFAALPLESVIRDRQAEYYRALRQADDAGQATPFVELVLAAILEACRGLPASDPVGDPVGDPVDALLAALGRGPTGTAELMAALALKHRASFRRRRLAVSRPRGIVRRSRLAIIAIATIWISCAWIACASAPPCPVCAPCPTCPSCPTAVEKPAGPATWFVTKVKDGDTLVARMEGGEVERNETIRLLNINTPETDQPGWAEASEALKALVRGGTITLEFAEPSVEKRDGFGRLLAFVFADGVNVNLEMTRQGWSKLYTKYGKGRLHEQFVAAEKEAREAQRGLWGLDAAAAAAKE